MKTKTLIIFISFVAVVVGITVYLRGNNKKAEPQNGSGFFINKNAIYVAEQAPGQIIVVSVVLLEQPSFVVIHEDVSDAPGKILGASNLLPSGETKSASVALSRETKNDETVYAMLHLDNGDGKFNAAGDKPVIDPIGNEPVMIVVVVSADAVLPGAVSP